MPDNNLPSNPNPIVRVFNNLRDNIKRTIDRVRININPTPNALISSAFDNIWNGKDSVTFFNYIQGLNQNRLQYECLHRIEEHLKEAQSTYVYDDYYDEFIDSFDKVLKEMYSSDKQKAEMFSRELIRGWIIGDSRLRETISESLDIENESADDIMSIIIGLTTNSNSFNHVLIINKRVSEEKRRELFEPLVLYLLDLYQTEDIVEIFSDLNSVDKLKDYKKFLSIIEKEVQEKPDKRLPYNKTLIDIMKTLPEEVKGEALKETINLIDKIPENCESNPSQISEMFEGLDLQQQDELFSFVMKKYSINDYGYYNPMIECYKKLDEKLVFDWAQRCHSSIFESDNKNELILNNLGTILFDAFDKQDIDKKRQYIDIVLSCIRMYGNEGTKAAYESRNKTLLALYKRLNDEEKKEFFGKFLGLANYVKINEGYSHPPTSFLSDLVTNSNSDIISLYYSQILDKLRPFHRLQYCWNIYSQLDDNQKNEKLDYTIQVIDSIEESTSEKEQAYYNIYLQMTSEMKIKRIDQFLGKFSEHFSEEVFIEYLKQFSSLDEEKKKEAYQNVFEYIEKTDIQEDNKKKAYAILFGFLPPDEQMDKYNNYREKMESDIDLISTLFLRLSRDKMPEVLTTSIVNEDRSDDLIGIIISQMQSKDVFEIFNNISLSDEFIRRVIAKCPDISIKMMAFDKDIDTEKISDLSEYEQFDNGIINVNSIVNSLFLNRSLSKEQINQKISDVYNLFTYNNLPEFIKTFRTFQLTEFTHKASNEYIESFKGKTEEERDLIILQELFILSLNSNNQSLRKFAHILEDGKKISGKLNGSHPYENIKKVNPQDYAILCQYRDTLFELHNLIREIHNNGKEHLDVSNDVIADLNQIIACYSKDGKATSSSNYVFNTSLILNELFGEFADSRITPKAMLEYMDKVEEESNIRHENNSNAIKAGTLRLEPGDWVKGIKSFSNYFPVLIRTSLKGGEFNQKHSHSDATQLDCDFGYITSENMVDSNGNIRTNDYEILKSSISGGYGSTWLVMKNYDERIKQRAEKKFGDSGGFDYTPDYYSLSSEGTQQDRYARVGIPVTDIDYIVTDEWQERFGYEMAMAGLFIPVKDIEGNLIFSIEDYNAIREKMAGLSEYGMDSFEVDEKAIDMKPLFETYKKISQKESTVVDDELAKVSQIISGESDEITQRKKQGVLDFIKGFFRSKGVIVVDNLSQNQSKKSVELIDTGSTGRGTNVPADGDFDFFLRHNISSEILSELSEYVKAHTPIVDADSFVSVGDGFRAKNVHLPSGEVADIDVTYGKKNLSLEYTSDLCVRDRLESIKARSPEKYNYVVANIMMAKKTLKAVGLYKKASSKGSTDYGGFGGIGVENWILQNGGSFAQAIDTFLEAAKSVKSHEEFVKIYPIFDFGSNHRGNMYLHDRFSAFLEGKEKNPDYGFNEAIKRFTEIQKMIREEQAKPHAVDKPEIPAVESEMLMGLAKTRRGFSFAQILTLQSKALSLEEGQK